MYNGSGNAVPAPANVPDLLSPAYTVSTRRLPQQMQYSAWTQLALPIDIEPPENPLAGFAAEHSAWNLGGVVLARTSVPAISFARGPRRIRSDSIDHWSFASMRRGTMQIHASGRTTNARPGGIHIQSLKEGLKGCTSGALAVHLIVPRDFCREIAATLDEADNRELRTGLGQLLAVFMLDLDRRLSLITIDELPRLLSSIRAMILACVDPTAERLSEAQGTVQTTRLEQARQFVRHHLFSPTLGTDELCNELGVSRSRLYRMFEPLGGVVHYIRHRRLMDVHAALSNAEDHRPIVDIAAERGFIDAADFSRAFKRAFGYRPSDARHQANVWPMHRDSAGDADEPASLTDLLRRLG